MYPVVSNIIHPCDEEDEIIDPLYGPNPHPYLETLRPTLEGGVGLAKDLFRDMISANLTLLSGNIKAFLAMAESRAYCNGSFRALGDLIKRRCDEITGLKTKHICTAFGMGEDGDLATVVSGDLHDIRKFFDHVHGFTDIIVNQEDSIDYAANGLSRFAQAVPAIKKMAKGLLDFETVKDIELAGALHTAILRIEKMVMDRQVVQPSFQLHVSHTNDFDLSTTVRLAPLHFYRILKNLAMNAADEGASYVRIVGEDGGEYICLKVQNDGPAIPPEVTPNLFKPRFSTHIDGKAPFSKGEGVGLSSSEAALRHMEGYFDDTIPSVSVEKGGLGGPQFIIYLKKSEDCACVGRVRGCVAAAMVGQN